MIPCAYVLNLVHAHPLQRGRGHSNCQPHPPYQLIVSNKEIEIRPRKIEEQNILLKESIDSVKDLLEK